MAITASIVMSPATLAFNQNGTLQLTVSNSGGASVNVTGVVPTAVTTGGTQQQTTGVNFGSPPTGTGLNVVVPAGGTLVMSIGLTAFVGTTGPIGGGAGTLTIGALVYTSDGSVTTASTATLTVNSFQSTLPAAQQSSAQPIAYG